MSGRLLWMGLVSLMLAGLAACGGGGGGSSGDTSAVVTVSGQVTFARIPFSAPGGTGLDYLGERQEPARKITVEAVNATTHAVLGNTVTDDGGNYSLQLPPNTPLLIRARAEMVNAAPQALPHYRFQVIQTLSDNSVYTYEGAVFDSGTSALPQNLAIPSGWNTATRTVGGPRASAPFAILDTVYKAYHFVLSVAPNTDFPVLSLDWASMNPGGETYFDGRNGGDERVIKISGEADVDTDEFDEHVIAHEFGHYIEDRFSRSDSRGGAHSPGDRLEPAVAFSEGYGYAFAAMVLNDPVPRDSFGTGQTSDSYFSVENDSANREGWYSEASVQEILWDLFDSNADGNDNIESGFQPIWDVLTSDQRDTTSVTSIFSFITALKAQNPALASDIDQIVADEVMVAANMDAFATTETNSADAAVPGVVLPVFTDITLGGGPRTVRSTNAYGTYNKLSVHRLLKLDLSGNANVRITATASTAGRDVDILVLKQGAVVASGETSSNEDFTAALQAGTYVLDTYDCANAECDDDVLPMPMDITVTVN